MKIAIIGGGNMGGATAWGLYRSHFVKPADIRICDLNEAKLKPFREVGMKTFNDASTAVDGADVVSLFVKPWLVKSVIESIRPILDSSRQTLVVVAAGVKSSDIVDWLTLSDESVYDGDFVLPPLFLAIPNIAIAQLSSMTFLVPIDTSDEKTAQVKAMFDAMGQTLLVEECMLAAGTMLASCGLAYAMRYVRASAEGGVELGFYPNQARDIVLQTVKGAVELLQTSGEHPETAIDKVTTPGGVTIKGLNEMENAGFTGAVIRGLKAGM